MKTLFINPDGTATLRKRVFFLWWKTAETFTPEQAKWLMKSGYWKRNNIKNIVKR